MTAERLAEIEARANAATPGPWWPEHRGVMAEGVEIVDDCAVAGWDAYPENQAFIAAARTDVPALVAEVRRLTAALAAHARHTDAAVDGVRAMLPAALTIARREGAEAMRKECAEVCERTARGAGEAIDDAGHRDIVRMYVGRRGAASECAAMIRALPLPGDDGGER